MLAELERGFGADLGAVRIHANEPAARRLNALAFTIGRHVAFAPGAWEPTSRHGRELLAHEVAHVLQQRRGGPVVAPTRHSRLDLAADAAATAVTGGRSGVQVDGGAAPGLARATPPGPVESSGLDTEIELIRTWLDENPEPSPERYAALEELRMLEERASSGQESTATAAGPGVLGTIGGALLGEFEHDPTVPMIIIDTLVSFVPYIDQLADGRDVLAHLYWMTDQGEYDQVLRWVGLVFSLIGCVPEIGTAIKGVSKLAIKGTREALEYLDELVALGKGLLPDGGDLRRLLAWIHENWTGWVIFGQAQWSAILNHARTGLETVPGVLLSSRDRLLGALGEVEQRSATALATAFDDVLMAIDEGMTRLMRAVGIEPDDLRALGGPQPALAGAGATQIPGKADDLSPSHAHMMAADRPVLADDDLFKRGQALGTDTSLELILKRPDFDPSLRSEIRYEISTAMVTGQIDNDGLRTIIGGLKKAKDAVQARQVLTELLHANRVAAGLADRGKVFLGAVQGVYYTIGAKTLKIDPVNEADALYLGADGVAHLDEVKHTVNALRDKLGRHPQQLKNMLAWRKADEKARAVSVVIEIETQWTDLFRPVKGEDVRAPLKQLAEAGIPLILAGREITPVRLNALWDAVQKKATELGKYPPGPDFFRQIPTLAKAEEFLEIKL